MQPCSVSFSILPVSSGFSCLAKVGEPVVALWARCLHEAALSFDFVLATKGSRSSWTGSVCVCVRACERVKLKDRK